MPGIVYGYARVSTPAQKLGRQIDNIRRAYPAASVYTDEYTGTSLDRPAFSKLMKLLRPGDTLVCDEVSRFSRDAEEGYALYMQLCDLGVELVFLKEPLLGTAYFKESLENSVQNLAPETGDRDADEFIRSVLGALDSYRRNLVRRGIREAFARAQAEIDYLHIRTAEGVRRAQADGKTVGRRPRAVCGVDFRETKKASACKAVIRKHSVDFGGSLRDGDVITLCREAAGYVSRNSYYKYKRELREAFQGEVLRDHAE